MLEITVYKKGKRKKDQEGTGYMFMLKKGETMRICVSGNRFVIPIIKKGKHRFGSTNITITQED